MFYGVLSYLCFPETFWFKLDFNLLLFCCVERFPKKKQNKTTRCTTNFSLSLHFCVAIGLFQSFHVPTINDFLPGCPGSAMLALRWRPPDWREIFATPVRAELCTLILSYLYDQQSPSPLLPGDIWRFSWCSVRVFQFAVRFREVQTPSLHDGEPDSPR